MANFAIVMVGGFYSDEGVWKMSKTRAGMVMFDQCWSFCASFCFCFVLGFCSANDSVSYRHLYCRYLFF